jgi:LysR family transcriptional regulator, hypochlorite-specific transcription factor HypT
VELKWLEDFASVARTGSFSRSAEERNVTQPAFSRRIKALEDWVGAPLIDRSEYPVTLTNLGKQFLATAEGIIRAATSVRDDFRLMSRATSNAIRIVTLHTLAATIVPDLVTTFLKQHPQARVSLSASVQGVEDHFDALVGATADVLITYGHHGIVEKAVTDGALDWLILERDQFVPVAAPAKVQEWGPRALSRERAGLPFLAYSSYSFSEKLILPVARRYARQLRVVYEDGLGEGLRAMALRGMGLAWLPLNLVRADLEEGRLLALEDEAARISYEIRAYKAQRNRSPMAEAMWAVLGQSAQRA